MPPKGTKRAANGRKKTLEVGFKPNEQAASAAPSLADAPPGDADAGAGDTEEVLTKECEHLVSCRFVSDRIVSYRILPYRIASHSTV